MEIDNPTKDITFYDRNRILIKALLVGGLILLMMVPATLIHNLVVERSSLQAQVIKEVSGKWANAQTVTGPVLMIPYTVSSVDKIPRTIRLYAYLLPDDLHINGTIDPEVRHRSLYDVTLYTSQLKLSGKFNPQAISSLQLTNATMLWDEARLLVGVEDIRGLQNAVQLNWAGTNLSFEAGLPDNSAMKSGISTPLSVNPAGIAEFSIQLQLRGSEQIKFVPVGKSTDVAINSKWPHPDFTGQYIPNAPTISDKGFDARWQIVQSSRPYPQAWKDGTPNFKASAFGVHLIQPADGYAKTERSVKYAILFIGLTFALFFLFEIVQKRQVHPVQYLLVGIALTLFYTLLLSISEYLGFNTAYVIAASATVSLTGMYVHSMFHSIKTAAGFTFALGGLYGYIFILIQLEDFSLLFGSIGLFVILAAIMYGSRKIDWYQVGGQKLQTSGY